MKTHITLEDLSAYIDGEVKDAEGLRAHLQQCSECAQRHVALARISASVQALPAPEPRAGFAKRVVAAIEDGEAIRRPWWQYLGAPLALAATVLLVAGLLAVRRGTDTTAPAGPDVAQAGKDAAGSASQAVAPGDSSEFADDWSGSDWVMAGARTAEGVETETEHLLMALAEVRWFDSLALYADNGRDVDAAFAVVYEEQPEAVLEVLTTYARSGDTR